MEDGGNRWSKPFVATLPMHALSLVRDLFDDTKRIELGQAVVNLEVENILRIEDIASLAVNSWVNNGLLSKDLAAPVRKAILAKHSHQRVRIGAAHQGLGHGGAWGSQLTQLALSDNMS